MRSFKQELIFISTLLSSVLSTVSNIKLMCAWSSSHMWLSGQASKWMHIFWIQKFCYLILLFFYKFFVGKCWAKRIFILYTDIISFYYWKEIELTADTEKAKLHGILLLSFSSRRMTCKLERVKMMKREM